MNIGQNILNAFDIMLEKRLQDAFSTTPQIIIAEISKTNIFANTYSIKYQGQEYSNVISNNNMIYSLGDVVQVLTDNSNYIIVGCLSQTGSQALYQDYLAQLAFDKIKINEVLADDALEVVLYSRLGKINHGVSEATIESFNKALQEAIRARCQASVIFEGAQSSETCSIEVIINSVAYSTEENKENEEEIKATRKIILSFNDLQNHPQQTQQDTVYLSSELGEWTLETVTFKRSQATIGASVKELYLTAESDTSSLADLMTMIIDSEKTIFEADEGVTELTQTVKIKNPTGDYFYTPGMKYLWGAEEPTIVSQDSTRYNDLLGEGWAPLGYTESQSYDISINNIPGSSRRFKCVALTDNNRAIANGIIELVNARNPQALPELKIEYTTTQAVIIPQSGAYSYWVQKTQNEEYVAHGKELDNIIDVKNIATINFVNSIVCSVYDQADKYLGSQAIFVFSDSANADSSLANERKKWIVVQDRATDTTYFDEDDIEWYNSPEDAFKNAYNGKDGKTRTHNGEITSALRELEFQQDNAGNYIPPFGYYLWRQTFKLWDNGVTSITRQLEAPEKPWVKEVAATEEYYILSTATEEPKKPKADPSAPTPDGHEYGKWILNENGWAKNVGDVSEQYPRKWQTIVTEYTDGSITVNQQSALVDIYTEETEEDVIIEKIELNIDDADAQVTVSIKYKDTLPHYGEYIFQTSKHWGNNSIQGFNEILVAWSDTNETAPGDEYFQDLIDDFFNTQSQNAYLWAKLMPSFSSINDEQNTSSVKLVIATTLGLARNFKSSTISYAPGTKDTIPTSGWNTDFELVAKKLDTINNYIWTATKTEYNVTLTATESGTDWIELNPSKDEGASRVLSWAAENDKTFIDGAKIYTGSIKADALDVTKLDAIAANIAGWKINSNSLSKDTTFLSAGHYPENDQGIYQRIAIGGEVEDEINVEQELTLENLPIETGVDGNTQEEINFFSFSIMSYKQPENVKCINITCITSEGQLGTLNDITLNEDEETVSQINEARWQYKVNVDGTRVKLIKQATVEYTIKEVPGLKNPAFEVLSDGSMNATKGHISGWAIKNLKEVTVKDESLPEIGVIYYDNKTYSVGLAEVHMSTSTGTPLATDPVFWAGYESSREGAGSTPWENNSDKTGYSWSSLTPFYVTGQGEIYATKGEIAGWTIGPVTGGLSGFYSKPDSKSGAGMAQVNYSYPSDPVFWAGYTGSGNTPWENDSTASGHSWSYYTPFYVTGEGGVYATNAHFSGNSSVEGRIIATSGSLKDLDLTGTMTFSSEGSIIQKSNNVQVCRWNDEGITIFKGVVGPWSILTEEDKTPGEPNNTYLQAVYYGTTDIGSADFNKPIYAYLQHDSLATWNKYTNTSSSVLWENITTYFENLYSDQKLKKNIENFTEPYEEFFDALQPKRYKYIAGTSGRYHTGFIAQEVVASLEKVGLSTQDFAAVTFGNTSAGNYWQLRRDEFISLNTWQIQKLKARVTELENKLNELLK